MAWDVQSHLEGMESRIREDIGEISTKLDTLTIDHVKLDGRVTQLEVRAGWLGAGIAASFAGILGIAGQWIARKLGITT